MTFTELSCELPDHTEWRQTASMPVRQTRYPSQCTNALPEGLEAGDFCPGSAKTGGSMKPPFSPHYATSCAPMMSGLKGHRTTGASTVTYCPQPEIDDAASFRFGSNLPAPMLRVRKRRYLAI
jgi:hypothetical protein